MEKPSHCKEVQASLDEVLLQARRLIRADVGFIYLIENNSLNFGYIHNDTLFGASGANRQLYQNRTLPVDKHALAGYVALTRGDLIGLRRFVDHAAAAIDGAMPTREVILRMIEKRHLRGPRKMGVHAHRVGAYAAEVYHQWSLKQGIAGDEIKRNKNLLRIAAMLHDLGKGAVSDLILQKPARLDAEEFKIMKYHTIHGARLFHNQASDLEVLSAEIALNHHEKWDGTGYPGRIGDIYQDQLPLGAGKRGEEIPLAGRIVALADVYDALMTRRAYKSPWSETMTLNYIKDQSGKHFDPEVVDAFLASYDVIAAIREKYQETDSSAGRETLL